MEETKIMYPKPDGLTLRKKIANRSESILEFDYCYVHDGEKYVVIDASYVFNRCSHDYYWNNLLVTVCKLRLLNPSAPRTMVLDGLRHIMWNAQKSLYYPTVLIDEADAIVERCYSMYNEAQLDNADELIHGMTREEIDAMSQSNQFTVVYDYRTIEWKPSVAKLYEFSEVEMAELARLESGSDMVAYNRYLSKLKASAKIRYSAGKIGLSKTSKTDKIVHDAVRAILENSQEDAVIKEDLYEHVRAINSNITKRMFYDAVKRISTTAEFIGGGFDAITNKQDYMVKQSENKLISAGYDIHNERKFINKNRVQERSGMSSRTVHKRWPIVEPTFTALNNKLTQSH